MLWTCTEGLSIDDLPPDNRYGGGNLKWPGRTGPGRFLPRIGDVDGLLHRRPAQGPHSLPGRRATAQANPRRVVVDIAGRGTLAAEFNSDSTPIFIIPEPFADRPADRSRSPSAHRRGLRYNPCNRPVDGPTPAIGRHHMVSRIRSSR